MGLKSIFQKSLPHFPSTNELTRVSREVGETFQLSVNRHHIECITIHNERSIFLWNFFRCYHSLYRIMSQLGQLYSEYSQYPDCILIYYGVRYFVRNHYAFTHKNEFDTRVPWELFWKSDLYKTVKCPLDDVCIQKEILLCNAPVVMTFKLQWRHNERDGISNHQPRDCLLKRLFRRRSKKTSKLRITGLGDLWIPRTKGQSRGRCFYLMTSSCTASYRH